MFAVSVVVTCAAPQELQPRIHVELFEPAGPIDRHGGPFVLELARSGITLAVPEDGSVLEAMLAAGVDVPSSCESGTCGTCETAVLSGEVDHRDSILTAQERQANDTMYVCVSRARSARLVLDA